MNRILRGFSALKQKKFLGHKLLTTNQFNFDSNEEIIENFLLNRIMLIGINIPDNKNMLTETAVENLYESLKKFYCNDEISVAVLHGMGGNFCSGVIQTEKTVEKCKEIINILHQGEKPIIVSLNGRVLNFGFQLAIMCDLKVLDDSCLIGFGPRSERLNILPVVFEKLVLTVGLSGASELLLTNSNFLHNRAYDLGLVSAVCPRGSVFGECISWANSISLSPLDSIKKDKAMINSYLKKLQTTV